MAGLNFQSIYDEIKFYVEMALPCTCSEASPTIWSCYANLNHYHNSFLVRSINTEKFALHDQMSGWLCHCRAQAFNKLISTKPVTLLDWLINHYTKNSLFSRCTNQHEREQKDGT